MSDHNFEKQIQQKLDELKIPPADTVWSSVEARIRKDKRRRRGMIIFPILMLLIATGFYFIQTKLLTSGAGSKSVLTNSLPDNNKNNVSEKSKTEQKLTMQDRLQDNVSNSTKRPDIKNAQKEESDRTKNSENEDRKIDNNNVIAENNPTAGPRNGSSKILNKKTSPGNNNLKNTKNNISLNKKRPQRRLDIDLTMIDQNALQKNNTMALDTKKKEESIPTEKETVSVSDSQANKTELSVAGIHIADSVPKDSALVQGKPVDSTLPNQIVEEKKTAEKKLKQSGWKWGLGASAGISNINDGSFIDGFIDGIISGEKALVADVSPTAFNNNVPGNAGPTGIINKPSEIEKGFSYSLGAFVQKKLSKRFSISTGLQYNYYSTHIEVGNRVDSFVMVQNAFGSLNVDRFYRSAPVTKYTNRFHFIELPVSVNTQLNKDNRLPVFWNAGLSLSYLVSTNALHFDSRTGFYYKNNGLFSKLQANLSTGFSISLWNASKTPVNIGPHLRYGLTNLMKQKVDDSKHLFYFGLNTKIFLNK
jgi:hypothetical protein